MQQIDIHELVSVKRQHVDEVGKIYMYKGEYIRLINKSKIPFVKKIIESGCLKELMEKGYFVDTILSDYCVQDVSDYILSHRAIHNPIKPKSWTFDMIKAAALLILDINECLEKYGYELKDCHTSNIIFDGMKPYYVDFGSISLKSGKWEQYVAGQFRVNYYYPLRMITKGYEKIVSAMYRESREIGCFNLDNILPIYYGAIHNRKVILALDKVLEKRMQKDARTMINKIENKNNSYWKDYQTQFWSGKKNRFSDSLEMLKLCEGVDSAIELGANQGFFTYLMSENDVAKTILATDYDYNAVNEMYLHFRDMSTKATIVPAVANVLTLTDEEMKEYCSDLVVANALTHHLLLAQNMDINVLFEIMNKLSRKYLLIEFMPLGLWTRRTGKKAPKGYHLEWFLDAMREYFEVITYKKIDTNRIAILGEKKNAE